MSISVSRGGKEWHKWFIRQEKQLLVHLGEAKLKTPPCTLPFLHACPSLTAKHLLLYLQEAKELQKAQLTSLHRSHLRHAPKRRQGAAPHTDGEHVTARYRHCEDDDTGKVLSNTLKWLTSARSPARTKIESVSKWLKQSDGRGGEEAAAAAAGNLLARRSLPWRRGPQVTSPSASLTWYQRKVAPGPSHGSAASRKSSTARRAARGPETQAKEFHDPEQSQREQQYEHFLEPRHDQADSKNHENNLTNQTNQ